MVHAPPSLTIVQLAKRHSNVQLLQRQSYWRCSVSVWYLHNVVNTPTQFCSFACTIIKEIDYLCGPCALAHIVILDIQTPGFSAQTICVPPDRCVTGLRRPCQRLVTASRREELNWRSRVLPTSLIHKGSCGSVSSSERTYGRKIDFACMLSCSVLTASAKQNVLYDSRRARVLP